VSPFAELELALRRDRELDRIGEAYSHRATREDGLGLIRGRDAILAAAVAEVPGRLQIEADLGEMIAYRVDDRWAGHRWVWCEDGRILREVVVEERDESRAAPACHPPLGELRAGEGQYSASPEPLLPLGFPAGARNEAQRLHRQWNGRALGRHADAWLIELLRLLPDATFIFEHALVQGADIALLWRVMGNHQSGKRVRLIGSTLTGPEGVRTVINRSAIDAQLAAETISYA
jgi:hypothetical protein